MYGLKKKFAKFNKIFSFNTIFNIEAVVLQIRYGFFIMMWIM